LSLNRSIRSVDLRIAIGEHYGFDFRERVRNSNSNSTAAIYFTRDQLDVIGRDLGVDVDEISRKEDLQDAIRYACDTSPRRAEQFDWLELKAVIQTAEINVSDDTYYDLEGDDTEADESSPPDDEPGIWAHWDGGDRGAD